MPTTPQQAFPYPALSDPANGPVGFQNLALALENATVYVRASTNMPPHVEGRVVYQTDLDRVVVSDGTAWRPLVAGSKTLTYSTATVTVASGNAGPKVLTGAPQTVQVISAADQFFVTVELDWSGAAGSTIATLQMQVDGVNNGAAYTFNVPSGRYVFSKSWRITGLAAGAHTISPTIQWGAGSSLDIVAPNTTCMIVEQRF